MAQKCVHKGCGKDFTDPDEPCTYHPGPPEFHEGQKGWKCCKPRVLTFDEFMSIPPCTTGKHSTVDDTPVEPKKPPPDEADIPKVRPVASASNIPSRQPQAPVPAPTPPPPPPETESDNPDIPIQPGTTCRRRGCNEQSRSSGDREGESCVFHPGQAVFHEGTKGWTCCKRRVLEFDEFMKIEGCKSKARHMFVGSGKGKVGGGLEELSTVRNDFYQTPANVMASFYLKKIDKSKAKIDFKDAQSLDLDLPTTDNKHYKATIPLWGQIDTKASSFRILGTKLEVTLVKADGASWPVLRSDDRLTGDIIQVGRAGRA